MSGLDDPHPAIEKALDLNGDPEALRDYYEGWASSYDDDVGAELYAVRDVIVDLFYESGASIPDWPRPDELLIVDAGCGTGLVGERLAADGHTSIDGVDLSDAMIEIAEGRGVYRQLVAGFDIAEPIDSPWFRAYDAAFVAGVFTLGHAPPEALANVREFVRTGGLLVVSARSAYYDQTNFGSIAEELVRSGSLEQIAERRDAPYTLDSTGHYFAYRVVH